MRMCLEWGESKKLSPAPQREAMQPVVQRVARASCIARIVFTVNKLDTTYQMLSPYVISRMGRHPPGILN